MPEPHPAEPYTVAALYQFRALPDPAALREELRALGEQLGLCGTLIVAPEGINGTVAGSAAAVAELRAFLLAAGFEQMEYKESQASEQPFKRFKVRLKKEIVTLGVPVAPRERVGTYLDPHEWNALLADPDVIVVDTRNRYEVKAGTFQGAVDPEIDSFREFPAWVDEHLSGAEGKKIAMFCTGGIRCEKSTSLLLQKGFRDVFHLRGGILKYLEDVPESESRWDGECFVFDGRVTVGHGLREGGAVMCHSCGWPLTTEERQHPHFEEGVSCEHCFHRTTDAQKAAFRDRQRAYETGQR
ncbi:rhodanese-related sulfurtransferase [Deinococcus wulumuqiensis]|uniref:oxygen-dependent tRNA uridine(34) hydroxylase TrhO n=1 Tax=Deinococcus wulumuqiensis TaxID=980427 RepID=UPI002430C3F0|nr:rhodanese-related sulfurtransferase [Deinococcus wulumuqiensis]